MGCLKINHKYSTDLKASWINKSVRYKKSENKERSSHPFGFNGQEKSDEIAGKGNHTTAQFWEYDTRIARRWNLDPVTKPWQSDYSVMSGNPIWKMDPDGADDFFNSDGSFSHRTKSGKLIKVITARETLNYSQLNANNPFQKSTLNNITQHYAKQSGVKGYAGVGNGDSGTAFTDNFTKNIFVNAKFGINPQLDNYNNLKNALVHEKFHAEAKTLIKSFADHANIYVKQMEDGSFKNTTEEFKVGTVASALQFLQNARIGNETIPSDAEATITKLESRMNNALKSSNINVTYDPTRGGGNAQNNPYYIDNKEGRRTVEYEAKKDAN